MTNEAVNFTFLGTGAPFGGLAQNATLTVSATSDTDGNCAHNCANGDQFTQDCYSGYFTFTDTALGTTLLHGVFQVVGTGATLSTNAIGGTGASFVGIADANDLNQLVLSSAYLNFVNQTQETASFSLSSVTPDFDIGFVTAAQAYPTTFAAAASGTFSSNPGPMVAPEPATFAMIGGGLIGLGVLRRRKVARL